MVKEVKSFFKSCSAFLRIRNFPKFQKNFNANEKIVSLEYFSHFVLPNEKNYSRNIFLRYDQHTLCDIIYVES